MRDVLAEEWHAAVVAAREDGYDWFDWLGCVDDIGVADEPARPLICPLVRSQASSMLLAPVVTEPPKAIGALKWTVREMERRYRSMSQIGVRNIGGYNEKVADAQGRGEVLTRRVQVGFDPETNRPVFEVGTSPPPSR